jgi:hypothetical protein
MLRGSENSIGCDDNRQKLEILVVAEQQNNPDMINVFCF